MKFIHRNFILFRPAAFCFSTNFSFEFDRTSNLLEFLFVSLCSQKSMHNPNTFHKTSPRSRPNTKTKSTRSKHVCKSTDRDANRSTFSIFNRNFITTRLYLRRISFSKGKHCQFKFTNLLEDKNLNLKFDVQINLIFQLESFHQ